MACGYQAALEAKTAATSHPHNMVNATLGATTDGNAKRRRANGINGTDIGYANASKHARGAIEQFMPTRYNSYSEI